MVDKVLFSSNVDSWQTPETLFAKLDNEFHFDLDPCTTEDNPLGTPLFFTKEDNGLYQSWKGNVFVNPPYNKEISRWLQKALYELKNNKEVDTIVFLIPVRTDTRWFHNYIYDESLYIWREYVAKVRFIRRRLRFRNAKNTAPFPSMIVIFRRMY